MEFIMNNWFIIIALLALSGGTIIALVRYFQMPTEEQLDKVREWLLYAVTEAEKALGGGTGQLKLHLVYDWFVERFPWMVKIISFEWFAELVDEALVEMREMLAKNEKIKAVVEGERHV